MAVATQGPTSRRRGARHRGPTRGRGRAGGALRGDGEPVAGSRPGTRIALCGRWPDSSRSVRPRESDRPFDLIGGDAVVSGGRAVWAQRPETTLVDRELILPGQRVILGCFSSEWRRPRHMVVHQAVRERILGVEHPGTASRRREEDEGAEAHDVYRVSGGAAHDVVDLVSNARVLTAHEARFVDKAGEQTRATTTPGLPRPRTR